LRSNCVVLPVAKAVERQTTGFLRFHRPDFLASAYGREPGTEIPCRLSIAPSTRYDDALIDP